MPFARVELGRAFHGRELFAGAILCRHIERGLAVAVNVEFPLNVAFIRLRGDCLANIV
jgi:hypothetical protein